MVPLPGFWIDRLSDSPQHLQGAGVTLLHMMISFAHQRPDECWGGVELLNLHHSSSREGCEESSITCNGCKDTLYLSIFSFL